MKEKLDKSLLDFICKSVQGCLAAMPVIVLGSGYSCAYGLPSMDNLSQCLISTIPGQLNENDKPSWIKFEEKIKKLPLENALQQVQMSQSLIELIVKETWKLIFPADRKLFLHLTKNSTDFHLSRLYRHLFRSTHFRLQVVTTNYDCLAEYAADIAGYSWATGFRYGYLGLRYGNQHLTISINQTMQRMVDVWKVHGSLDWYRYYDGTTFFLPSLVSLPEESLPAIVTPGTDKYRQTHEEPFRTIIAGADNAIDAGKSFLCIGYGFNDDHIQPKLLEKCIKQEKIIVVLAKKLTEAAKKVLLEGRCRCFIAFEESPHGTFVYTPEIVTGIELHGKHLWLLGDLLDQVL